MEPAQRSVLQPPLPPNAYLVPSSRFSEALTAASAPSGLGYTILYDMILLYYALLLPLESHSLTFGPLNQLVQLCLQDLIRALPQSRLLCPLRAAYHPALLTGSRCICLGGLLASCVNSISPPRWGGAGHSSRSFTLTSIVSPSVRQPATWRHSCTLPLVGKGAEAQEPDPRSSLLQPLG